MGSPGGFLKVPDGYRQGEPGFMALLEAQGGRCAICGDTGGMELICDHDHLSGRARGLLCHNCNVGIGFLGDDVERLRIASTYIAAWRLLHAEQAAERRQRRRDQHAGVRRSSLYGPDGEKTRAV